MPIIAIVIGEGGSGVLGVGVADRIAVLRTLTIRLFLRRDARQSLERWRQGSQAAEVLKTYWSGPFKNGAY